MLQEEEIVQVYFMPGMAANAAIFEYIKLPEDKFEVHYLEWIIPLDNESLKDYALRMNRYVKHDNIVLIGVSFGGVVVQEMSNHLNVRRLIIISSVKCRDELPRRMRFAAKTGFFKLIPTSLLDYVDHFEKLAVNDFLRKRARLYRKYLSVRNNKYLDWAIKNMVCWDCEKPRKDLVHIHGDSDLIFPHKYINGCITVKGGTHIMIINKYRWFNRYLPEIILTGEISKKKKNKKVER
jgi:pimeloyl-ACP methyl ester carboxylesterase